MELLNKYDPDLYKNHPNYEKIKTCKSLSELKNLMLTDKNLEIAKKATHLVFCDGVENARLMIIGEAPGRNEDESGIPFCGRSGQLLDSLLEKFNLSRKNNLYITNVVNWRPDNNRTPFDEEIEYCLPYLEKHIALQNPKLILALGTTATKTLLFTKKISITGLRKKNLTCKNYFSRKEIPFVATFHPSYLIYRSDMKQEFESDLKFLSEKLAKILEKV